MSFSQTDAEQNASSQSSSAPDQLLTFKEAMDYLRVSRSTLYRLMWSGQLTGHKVGSTWRFYREDLQACVHRVPTSSTGVLLAPVGLGGDIAEGNLPVASTAAARG